MGECDKTIPAASAVPIAQPVPCVPVAVPAALRHYYPPAHLLYGMMPLPVLSPTPTFTGAANLAGEVGLAPGTPREGWPRRSWLRLLESLRVHSPSPNTLSAWHACVQFQ